MKNNNTNEGNFSLISVAEKKKRGFDMPSFNKRMKNRLKKVRGDNNEDVNFFTRHNFQGNQHN